MSSILGIIPARAGSKGIPGKNARVLAGKPLIRYTIEVALASGLLAEVMVSTDGPEIAKISREAGAVVPGLRPPELATDASPTLDTVRYHLEQYRAEGRTFDAVCLLQPTSPFRTVEDLQKSIIRFQSGEFDSLVSVVPVPAHYNPHWVFFPDAENHTLRLALGDQPIISRRQDLPAAYVRNGAIYLTKSDVILSEDSLYGRRIGYYEMPEARSLNLDTMDDWRAAEKILTHPDR